MFTVRYARQHEILRSEMNFRDVRKIYASPSYEWMWLGHRGCPVEPRSQINNRKQEIPMADKLTNSKTSLPGEEVIVRAVQFFASEKFRCSGQSGRTATFDGRPPIPWFLLLLTVLGFMFCIVPGIIMYILAIRKLRRFYNLVVTANPIPSGTEVSITHPDWAGKQVQRFMQSLPGTPAPNVPPLLAVK
jgi:hypothetical protein